MLFLSVFIIVFTMLPAGKIAEKAVCVFCPLGYSN